jgi:hypothetical protein
MLRVHTLLRAVSNSTADIADRRGDRISNNTSLPGHARRRAAIKAYGI